MSLREARDDRSAPTGRNAPVISRGRNRSGTTASTGEHEKEAVPRTNHERQRAQMAKTEKEDDYEHCLRV